MRTLPYHAYPSVQFVLGGRKYTAQPLPIAQAQEWRQKWEKIGRDVSAGKTADLGQMLYIMRNTVMIAPNLALDLLCEYASEVKADRERIDADAYDDEVLVALAEIIKLEYHFNALTSGGNGHAH